MYSSDEEEGQFPGARPLPQRGPRCCQLIGIPPGSLSIFQLERSRAVLVALSLTDAGEVDTTLKKLDRTEQI